MKLIAGAAAFGALSMVVKPWRLLSTIALLGAMLKTSDIADWVTLLAPHDNKTPRKDL